MKEYCGFQFEEVAVPDRNVRLKLTSRCQWSCSFCHMEGMHGSPTLCWSEERGAEILTLMSEMRRAKVHLTGGEPTLHPRVQDIVRFFTENGMDVAITSNGQFGAEKLDALIQAGCRGFTFSFPTLSAADFAGMHAKPFPITAAATNIANIQRNIAAVRSQGIKCDVNVVFSERVLSSDGVLAHCAGLGVDISLLDVIGDMEGSRLRIRRLVREFGLRPKSYKRVIGTSRARYQFVHPASGVNVSVKTLEHAFVNAMCAGCPKMPTCEEKYYGIRIEQGADALLVRTCLHKNVLTRIQEFPASPIGREILMLGGTNEPVGYQAQTA